MARKIFFLLLIFGLAFIVACSPAEEEPESTPLVEELPEVIPVDEAAGGSGAAGGSIELANECDEPGAGLYLLNFPAQGICFHYPEQYDLLQEGMESSLTFYVDSILNTEAPSFSVSSPPPSCHIPRSSS